jgi:hypothetical protein
LAFSSERNTSGLFGNWNLLHIYKPGSIVVEVFSLIKLIRLAVDVVFFCAGWIRRCVVSLQHAAQELMALVKGRVESDTHDYQS